MAELCEACGWTAALVSMVCFGSCGVPLKMKSAQSVDPDPLVYQTYMTIMCFLTSFLVLAVPGTEFVWTPWGIVSALFWVPGGVSTIYAIKKAGLAVAVGIGNSFIVLVSFTWGIFIFQEDVKSRLHACLAVVIMCYGIVGMSYFSSPPEEKQMDSLDEMQSDSGDDCSDFDFDSDFDTESLVTVMTQDCESLQSSPPKSDKNTDDADAVKEKSGTKKKRKPKPLEIDTSKQSQSKKKNSGGLSERTKGILAAIFQGVWGGSIMVPMHWAGDATDGIAFTVSFGIGAMIITFLLWVMRYLLAVCQNGGSMEKATKQMPAFHLSKMLIPGAISGFLWNSGNVFSMISVTDLGEGVGYSVIQAGMLVSGLWGIFVFGEIVGNSRICKWFLSAIFAIAGILFLSYEHHAGEMMHNMDSTADSVDGIHATAQTGGTADASRWMI